MDLNNPSIKFASITIMHQKKENILPDAKTTTYTFFGVDFKTLKCDDFDAEDDAPLTYQVYSPVHVRNSGNISKSRTTLLNGGEDDELMTHLFNSYVHARNYENILAPMSGKQKCVGVCKNNSKKVRTFVQIAGASADFANPDELGSCRIVLLFFHICA
jgi:hypothetical protein